MDSPFVDSPLVDSPFVDSPLGGEPSTRHQHASAPRDLTEALQA
ncbi:hypothetical protein ACN28E_38870 [Archangium lansingense]